MFIMSFKELAEELDFFNELPLWGKILTKIFADACWVVGATVALAGALIDFITGKNGY